MRLGGEASFLSLDSFVSLVSLDSRYPYSKRAGDLGGDVGVALQQGEVGVEGAFAGQGGEAVDADARHAGGGRTNAWIEPVPPGERIEMRANENLSSSSVTSFSKRRVVSSSASS